MKQTIFIKYSELRDILAGHLKAEGHEVPSDGRLKIASLPDGVVVIGAGLKNEQAADAPVTVFDDPVTVFDASATGGSFDRAVEADVAHIERREKMRAVLRHEPLTIREIADKVGIEPEHVVAMFGVDLDVFAAAPRREDGSTVSAYLLDGTVEAEEFRQKERARVEARTEECRSMILEACPRHDEEHLNRPQIVDSICEIVDESVGEALRRDARAIFYTLRDQGLLEHVDRQWRRADPAGSC